MDEYLDVILLTFFGFLFLAFILLAPVYVFLRRERKLGDQWTREILGGKLRGPAASGNGTPHAPPDEDEPPTS